MSDWIFAAIIGVCIAAVIALIGCLIFIPESTDTYCGPGWSGVCFDVPKDVQPQHHGDCISYDNQQICGSYEKE